MEEFPKVTAPRRLAGICKKCHEFRYGYLIHGRDPFICYQCAELATKTVPSTGTTSTTLPDARSYSFTFTTSNSTSTVSPTGDFRTDYTQGVEKSE